MKIIEGIEGLFRRGPKQSDQNQQQIKRRLESIARPSIVATQPARETTPAITQVKPVSTPVEVAPSPNQAKIAELEANAQSIRLFMNSSDSSGETRKQDAERLLAIQRQIEELKTGEPILAGEQKSS